VEPGGGFHVANLVIGQIQFFRDVNGDLRHPFGMAAVLRLVKLDDIGQKPHR